MADLEQIYHIELISFQNAYPLSLLRQLLRDHNTYCLVIEVNQKIIGFAFGIMRPNKKGHIVSVAVHPDMRHCNYGSILLTKLIEVLKNHDAKILALEVRISNTIAQKLYKKFDFQVKGTKKHYYSNGEDAYYMVHEFTG